MSVRHYCQVMFVILLLSFSSWVAWAGSPHLDHAVLPAGVAVKARIDTSISSASARVGQHLTLVATEDVVVGGFVVIPKGTPGVALVFEAQPAGAFGKAGGLTVNPVAITTTDGSAIKLSGAYFKKGDEGPALIVGGVVGGLTWYLVGGPAGIAAALLGAGLTSGSEAVINEKTELLFRVAHDSLVFFNPTSLD